MNVSSALLMTAAAIAVGVADPSFSGPAPWSQGTSPAMVRFGNQLSANRTVTLRGNGVVLFNDVPARTMTEYVAQTDSVITFSIRVGMDTNEVSMRSLMASGGYYSVIALNGPDNRPTITVRRDSVRRAGTRQ